MDYDTILSLETQNLVSVEDAWFYADSFHLSRDRAKAHGGHCKSFSCLLSVQISTS